MNTKNPPPGDERSSVEEKLTHAGGIVRRNSPTGVQYLFVQSRRDRMLWVAPKGHIESGETPEQTAMREVREEAGVEASIESALGTVAFEYAGEQCRVLFYLMRFVREVPPSEQRLIAWHNIESALVSTPFPDVRALLMRAHSQRIS